MTTVEISPEHRQERMTFRRHLARLDRTAAIAAIRDLVTGPPAWAAGWKVFGALWSLPGGSIELADAAVHDGVVAGQTFAELTDTQRDDLARWLDQRGAE